MTPEKSNEYQFENVKSKTIPRMKLPQIGRVSGGTGASNDDIQFRTHEKSEASRERIDMSNVNHSYNISQLPSTRLNSDNANIVVLPSIKTSNRKSEFVDYTPYDSDRENVRQNFGAYPSIREKKLRGARRPRNDTRVFGVTGVKSSLSYAGGQQ